MANGLYERCHINFASEVPRALLEELTRLAIQNHAESRVAGVFDRYVSFVSLASNLFSLNLPAAYRTLNSISLPEKEIHAYVERIVDGLMSATVTMEALPVIRCPPGTVAETVGRRLDARLRALLQQGGPDAGALFLTGNAGLDGQRPLLCLLDRDLDLATMLSHTWTYEAMAHDLLELRLKKLVVPVDGDDPAAPPQATVLLRRRPGPFLERARAEYL